MEYEERSNPLDSSYLELLADDLDARRAAEAAEDEVSETLWRNEAGEGEPAIQKSAILTQWSTMQAPSTPLEALEKFTMALVSSRTLDNSVLRSIELLLGIGELCHLPLDK